MDARFVATALTAALLAGCTAVRPGADVAAPAPRVSVGDSLAITVKGHEAESLTCEVNGQGNIVLPVIGHARVEGMTPAQVKRMIQGLYIDRGVYRDLDVDVESSR